MLQETDKKMKIVVVGVGSASGVDLIRGIHPEKYDVVAVVTCGLKDDELAYKYVQKELPMCAVLEDKGDKESLKEAFEGAQVLVIWPMRVEQSQHAIQLAKEMGIEYCVLISAVLADQPEYKLAEQMVPLESEMQTGLKQWTILRATLPMQILLLYAEDMVQGSLPLPIGQSKFSPIDTMDLGRLVAHMAQEVGPHAGKCYNLTGPESIDGITLAGYVSQGLNGKEVSFVAVEQGQAKEILSTRKIDEQDLEVLLDAFNCVSLGKLNVISYDFKNLTREEGNSVTDFTIRYKDWVTKKESEDGSSSDTKSLGKMEVEVPEEAKKVEE